MLPQIQQKRDVFISIYKAVHKCNDEDATNFFEVEKFQFERKIGESEDLSKCTDASKISVFLEVISNGLSFDSSSKHVYLIAKSFKVGENQWEKRLTYTYAVDGLVYLCKSARSIQDCTPPVIVYEGDKIEVGSIDGSTTINYMASIPRKSNKILGGFVFVTYGNGRREGYWMPIEDVTRLAKASEKQNRGTANALYSSNEGQIDTGFFATKIVKTALKHCRRKPTLNQNEYNEEEIHSIDPPSDMPMLQAGDAPTPIEIMNPTATPTAAPIADTGIPMF